MNMQAFIDRYNALDAKIRYGIFGGLVLSFLALDFFTVFQWQLSALSKTSEEIQAMNTNIQRVDADMQRFKQTKGNLEKSAAELSAITDKIRPRSQSSAVLEDISRLANESDVSIDQLAPSKDGEESLTSPAGVKYYALPIVINAQSGYHMFGRFLNKIESKNLIVLTRDLQIEGGNTPEAKLNIQATIKVIVWDNPPESKK